MPRTKYVVPGFYSRMLALAIPIALQNMLASCAGLVDTAMVARLGNAATSAVGIGGKWIMFLQMISFGICSGGSVLISQYWGAGEHKGVHKAYCVGMYLCLAAAAVYTVVLALFPYQMMCLFTEEEPVRQAGVQYLSVVCWGLIPWAFANIANMARRCVEDVRTPLVISTVAVCVNTFFNWCLIYGKCGMPEMGLRGAALATVLSHCVQAILVILIGLKQKHFTLFGLNELRGLSKAFLRKYFHIALPVICNETLWCVGFNLYAVIFARQGSDNYAAYTLYSSIEQLVFVFFVGACNACAIMIGKSIGQNLLEDAKAIAHKMLGVFVCMGAVLGTGLLLLRWPIIRLMGVENPYTAQMTANILAFYCCWCPLRQLNYVLVVGILRSGGDTRVSAQLDVGVTLAWGAPMAFVLAYLLKLPFLWLVCGTFVAEDIVKLPLCLWRLKSGKWIHCVTKGEVEA